MTEINITPILKFDPENIMTDFNTETCFDWCLEQQIVHSNNIEVWSMFFPFLAFIMLILYFWSFEVKTLEKYRNGFIYMARLFLIVFFAIYILIIRMRVIY